MNEVGGQRVIPAHRVRGSMMRGRLVTALSPSLEATLEEYRGVRASLAEQIEAIAPGVRFVSTMKPRDHYPDHRRPCSGEWLGTDGRSVGLAMWASAVPIGEEAW